MERITVTIEGTTEEIIASIFKLAQIQQRSSEEGVSWLDDEINDFVANRIQTEARQILKEMANRPSGYDRDQLIQNMRLTGRGLAGRLSSIGHNIRKYYPMKRHPINLDETTWSYTLLPEFARWLTSHDISD